MAPAAQSVSRYLGFFRTRHLRSVLDYGAGTLRNSKYLAQAGFEVYAADLPAQVERIMGMAGRNQLAGVLATDELEHSHLDVDLVISSYVLNIILDGTEKSRYLKNIVLNLKPHGYLLIEVRCRTQAEHCHNCTSCSKEGSCIKTYSHAQMDALLAPYGFQRICHYYSRHAVAVLYQEMDA
jgi:SAM-dependent methyltransferase